MAKPDCDDGWYKLSHELDEALAFARFTHLARIVLRQVFAQIYGPAKRKAAQLSPTTIAKIACADKSNVFRAIEELVEAKVLKDHQGYTFVKDYEKWRRNGEPMFSKEELEEIRAAPQRAMSFKLSDDMALREAVVRTDNGLLSPLTTVVISDNGSASELQRAVVRTDNGLLSPLTTPMPRARVLETMRLRDVDDVFNSRGGETDLTAALVGGCMALGLPAAFAAKLRAERRVLAKEFGDDPSWLLGAMRCAAPQAGEIRNLFGWCLDRARGYREAGAIPEPEPAEPPEPPPVYTVASEETKRWFATRTFGAPNPWKG